MLPRTITPPVITLTKEQVEKQIELYNSGKGVLKQTLGFYFTNPQTIQEVENFLKNCSSPPNKRLNTKDLYELFNILITSTTIEGHLSDTAIKNIKSDFGLDLLEVLKKAKAHAAFTFEQFSAICEHPSPLEMGEALLKLQTENELYNDENISKLSSVRNPLFEVEKLIAIDKLIKILKSKNLNSNLVQKTINEHPHPQLLLEAFNNCRLSRNNFAYLIAHPQPLRLAKAFALLDFNQSITLKSIIDELMKQDKPDQFIKRKISLTNIQRILELANLNKEEKNWQDVQRHPRINQLNEALSQVCLSLLTQTNFTYIVEHRKPISMAKCILLNDEHKELQIDLNIIKKSANPELAFRRKLAEKDVITLLQRNHLDKPAHVDAVKQHPDTEILLQALTTLQSCKILCDDYVAATIKHCNPLSLAAGLAFMHFASYIITIDFDNNIKRIRQEDDPSRHAIAIIVGYAVGIIEQSYVLTSILEAISKYFKADILQYFKNLVQEAGCNSVNYSQNSHIPSVQESSAESAKRLLRDYEGKFILETTIDEIKTWAKSDLPKCKDPHITPMIESVKTAVDLITDPKCNYIDPISEISLKKLMCLTWLAIHDKEHLACEEDLAMKLFIEAFHESIRGEYIHDSTLPDDIICYSGIFEKFIEKLTSIHPDAEIIVFNNQTAKWKLESVVKEEIATLLTHPKTHEKLIENLEKLDNLKKHGIEAVWPEIEGKVENRMWSEYEELYVSRTNPSFTILVNGALDLEFTDYGKLKQRLFSNSLFQNHLPLTQQRMLLFQPAPTTETPSNNNIQPPTPEIQI